MKIRQSTNELLMYWRWCRNAGCCEVDCHHGTTGSSAAA